MNQAFNPYREWLGIESDTAQPDHYALLGLAPGEQDSEAIRAAADRAAARVRSFRPGPQAAAWARLLDELKAAKQCLTDPDRKAAYDQRLQTAPAPSDDPPATPDIAVVNRDANLYPPGMAPPGTVAEPDAPAPAKADRTHASSTRPPDQRRRPKASASRTASTRELTAPAAATGKAPQAVPRPASKVPGDPPATGPQGRPAEPQAVEVDRVSLGLADPDAEYRPINAHVSPPVPQRASAMPWVLAVAVILVIATLAMLYIAVYSEAAQNTPPANPSVPGQAARVAQVPAQRSARATSPARSRSGRPLDPRRSQPITSRPANRFALPANELSEPAADPTDGKSGDKPAEDSAPPAGKTGDPATSQPAAQDPGPPSPYEDDPFGPPPDQPAANPPDPEMVEPPPANASGTTDVARLQQAFRNARASLRQRDFESARLELDKAKLLAQSAPHQAMLKRLEVLGYHCQQFWDAVARSLRGLQGTEELSVGGGKLIVIVVETGPDWIVIRREGRNERYSLDQIPAPLALAIADRTLDPQAPATLLMKGACLALDKNATPEYLEKAQAFWREAQQLGTDVSDLAEALDDDYEQLAENTTEK